MSYCRYIINIYKIQHIYIILKSSVTSDVKGGVISQFEGMI